MTTEHDDFVAFTLHGELDLNRLSIAMGIGNKYRWEEPMLLNPDDCSPLKQRTSGAPQCFLYYFGAVVFVNCTDGLIRSFCDRMSRFSDLFSACPSSKFRDTYSLKIEGNDGFDITNDYAVMPRLRPAFVDIICFVIAKSVALERIEEQVDLVLDEMEGVMQLLEKGSLALPDRKLARLASSILNFKYKSIAHIMVLDKPDITWDNDDLDLLYSRMANLFELSQRYQEIRAKSETLMDITEVFTGLSHARRATRLEWIIIILIALEIVIYVVEIFLRR
jgi:uncharacterized Rmd1/YagE family protein